MGGGCQVALDGAQREWSKLALQSIGGCRTKSGRPCDYDSASMARVGEERIRVGGEEIDAVKLRVDVEAICNSCGPSRTLWREATY